VLEERVAALEGGTAALAVASGHAAEFLVMHALMQTGDEFVAAKKLYGGSINQFNHSYKNFGWNVVWADSDDPSTFEAAITAKTKALFVESIANPGGVIVDLAAISAIAKRHNIPFIVDNTMASPYLIRPFEHGADIVVHSATKFLGGHGNFHRAASSWTAARSTGRATSASPCSPSRGPIRRHGAGRDLRQLALLPSPGRGGSWGLRRPQGPRSPLQRPSLLLNRIETCLFACSA
jgi:cystathionine beta-lyase/cystathionine gamma-synthase